MALSNDMVQIEAGIVRAVMNRYRIGPHVFIEERRGRIAKDRVHYFTLSNAVHGGVNSPALDTVTIGIFGARCAQKKG